MNNNVELKLPDEYKQKTDLGNLWYNNSSCDVSIVLNNEATNLFGFNNLYVLFVHSSKEEPNIKYDGKRYDLTNIKSKIMIKSTLDSIFKTMIVEFSDDYDNLETIKIHNPSEYSGNLFNTVASTVIKCTVLKCLIDNTPYDNILKPGTKFKREWIESIYTTNNININPDGIKDSEDQHQAIMVGNIYLKLDQKFKDE